MRTATAVEIGAASAKIAPMRTNAENVVEKRMASESEVRKVGKGALLGAFASPGIYGRRISDAPVDLPEQA